MCCKNENVCNSGTGKSHKTHKRTTTSNLGGWAENGVMFPMFSQQSEIIEIQEEVHRRLYEFLRPFAQKHQQEGRLPAAVGCDQRNEERLLWTTGVKVEGNTAQGYLLQYAQQSPPLLNFTFFKWLADNLRFLDSRVDVPARVRKTTIGSPPRYKTSISSTTRPPPKLLPDIWQNVRFAVTSPHVDLRWRQPHHQCFGNPAEQRAQNTHTHGCAVQMARLSWAGPNESTSSTGQGKQPGSWI